jgi:hypothetical protein
MAVPRARDCFTGGSTMPSEKDNAKLDRRSLLKGAGLALGAAGAATASKVAAAAPAQAEKAPTTGYAETDHVRTYYKLARF